MSAIDHLLKLAEVYSAHTSTSAVTLSWRVFGDSKKLDAISNGKDIQVRRFEKAMDWFEANWPEELAWPVSVPRREPAPELADAAAARRSQDAVA